MGVKPMRVFSVPVCGPELELLELIWDIRLHLNSFSCLTVNRVLSISMCLVRLELFSTTSFLRLSTVLLDLFFDSSVSLT